MIDIAIPYICRVTINDNDNFTKHAELMVEVSRIWEFCTMVILIAIRVLGFILRRFKMFQERISISKYIDALQKSAIPETA